MKKYSLFVVLLLLISLSMLFTISIHATSSTTETNGFILTPVNIAMWTKYLDILEISCLSHEPNPSSISCFAVSESEQVAIGVSSSTSKIVCVYSDEGDYQYGFSFSSDGSFGLEWEGNQIAICLVRSNVRIVIDEKGNCVRIDKIEDNIENESYWRNHIKSNKYVIDDVEYEMTNSNPLKMLSSTYSTIIKTDINGDKIVLYDSKGALNYNFVAFSFIFLMLLITLVIVFGLNRNKKYVDKT